MIYIRGLERGGYSARGATFEPRDNKIVLPVLSGEAHDLTVTFWTDVSSVTKEQHGLDATAATITDAKFTSRINGIQAGGYLIFTVTLDSGEERRLRVEASPAFARSLEYGAAIQTETEEALILE